MARPYIWIVGFPRCGSASLCEALRVLGWNPIHNPRNWDQLEDYNAAGDVMITAHWRELDRMFPGSRFILNTRHFDDWIKSLQCIPGFWRSSFFYDRYYRQKVYGGITPNDANALRRVWTRHYEDVTAAIPDDRLLVYRQPFAWEPLCDFLERPAPAKPFPWLNRASNRDAKIRLG